MTDNSYLLQYFIEHSSQEAKSAPKPAAKKEEDNTPRGKSDE